MSNELKPCPFCGSEKVFINDEVLGFLVECKECCTEGPYSHEKQEAIDRWNQRATLSKVGPTEKEDIGLTLPPHASRYFQPLDHAPLLFQVWLDELFFEIV